MTLHNAPEGLHRRPATSKYDQVFGNQTGRPLVGDEEIRVFESLLQDRSTHLHLMSESKQTKTVGIGDALIGLIPIILLAMVMLFFLFAVLTLIRAFMSVHMKDN